MWKNKAAGGIETVCSGNKSVGYKHDISSLFQKGDFMIPLNPTTEKLSVMVRQTIGGELQEERRPELFIMIPKIPQNKYQHPGNVTGGIRPDYKLVKISSRHMIILSRTVRSIQYFA